MPDQSITVLIADDHPLTRAGICATLSGAPDIEVIGQAEDGDEAKRLVEKLHPRILLLDLIMPGIPPHQLERWVRENYPDTITLVLTGNDRDA